MKFQVNFGILFDKMFDTSKVLKTFVEISLKSFFIEVKVKKNLKKI